MSLTALLTACATSTPAAQRLLLQPRVLRLQEGQAVPTSDGQYRPQVDEVWHSPAAMEGADRQIADLTATVLMLRQQLNQQQERP